MSEEFIEVSHESWGSRLMNSIKSVFFGILLFVAAFPLLWWNEGRSVERARSLNEVGGSVVSIAADKVDPTRQGKPVHATAQAATSETLADPDFGVTAQAIFLKRTVQMYQWEEDEESKTEKNLGGSTTTTKTYTYEKKWSESVINSGEFKKPAGHQNPSSMPYATASQQAKVVNFGAFTLPPTLVEEMDQFEALSVPQDAVAKAPENIRAKTRLDAGGLYVGADPVNPQIGDLKISFEVVKPNTVSIIANQINSTFEPIQTSAGGTVAELRYGTVSAPAMIKMAQDENVLMTWLIRLGGFLLMAIGLAMVFSPLVTLADVVPFIGSILGAGTFMVSLFVSLFFSSFTIGLAWVRFRPMVGIPLLVVGVGAVVLVSRMGKNKLSQKAAA